MKTAYATIKGFEAMRMFRKGQMLPWQLLPGFKGEVYLVERIFGIEDHSLYEKFWNSLKGELEDA